MTSIKDLEAAVERVWRAVSDPTASVDTSDGYDADDLRTILASHAALMEWAFRLENKLRLRVREITMQDVRLGVGEGPLSASEVLAGVNAELRRRARVQDRKGGLSCPPAVTVEAVAAIIRDECYEVRDGELQGSNEAAARIIEQFKRKA